MKKEEIDKCLKLMTKCEQFNRGVNIGWYRVNDNMVGFEESNDEEWDGENFVRVKWVESIMEDEEIQIESEYIEGESYVFVELTNDQAIIFMEKVNEELDDRYKEYFKEKGADWIN